MAALLKAAALARSTIYYRSKLLNAGDRHKDSRPGSRLSMSATRAATAASRITATRRRGV